MALEDSKSRRASRRKRTQSTVRVLASNQRLEHPLPEVRHEGDHLEITMSAPEITPGRFRYSVGRRYFVVWSEASPHDRHRFLHLPQPVVPERARVRFVNGVVDAELPLA